jgi:hypothetical protein
MALSRFTPGCWVGEAAGDAGTGEACLAGLSAVAALSFWGRIPAKGWAGEPMRSRLLTWGIG